ncbi:MAG: PilZ domain-containing protein [Myxococcota bacterium]
MSGGKQGNPAARYQVTVFIGEGEDMVPFGRTRDLSVSGVFLETEERPDIGSLRLISVVWGDDTFVCRARVVRHTNQGIGLTFVEPPGPFVDVITDIVSNQPTVGFKADD